MWMLNFFSFDQILSLIPVWISAIPIVVGMVGLLATFLMKFIPFVYVYRSPLQIISILLIAIGTFVFGALITNGMWISKAEEMRAKIAEAEKKSKEENIKIVERVVIKTEAIKENSAKVNEFIESQVSKHDSRFAPGGQCEIPKEVVEAINNAARSNP